MEAQPLSSVEQARIVIARARANPPNPPLCPLMVLLPV
jgi:hypothetical protein